MLGDPRLHGSRPHGSTALARRGRALDLALWLVFAAAFLPTLSDLARHLVAEPWALYCVVFFGLFAREAILGIADRRRLGMGLALVSLALIVEFVMVTAAWIRLARPALALGMVGVALALGRPRFRHSLLALWAIPLPSAVLALGFPLLEAVVRGVAPELPLTFSSPLETHSEVLMIRPQDSGLPLAASMAGLGWYSAVRSGLASERGLWRAIRWASLGIAIQACVVGAALMMTSADAVQAAGWVLLLGPWLVAGLLGLAWARRERQLTA